MWGSVAWWCLGLRWPQFNNTPTLCVLPSRFLTFTHGLLLFCSFLSFARRKFFVRLRLVCVLVSACLAGLCAVWKYAWGLGPHLLWSSCNCSFGALSLALSPSPSLSLCLSPSLFGLLPSFFFFALTTTPLLLFSPCMAHYGWSPPVQSGNSLYTHTHRYIQSHSAVFRAACRSDGLCAICYKTALVILFGREVETIAPSHFFVLQLVQTDSSSSLLWLSEQNFS